MYIVASRRPIFCAAHNDPVVQNIARYPPPLPISAIFGICLSFNERLSIFSRAALTIGRRFLRDLCSPTLIPGLRSTKAIEFLYGFIGAMIFLHASMLCLMGNSCMLRTVDTEQQYVAMMSVRNSLFFIVVSFYIGIFNVFSSGRIDFS